MVGLEQGETTRLWMLRFKLEMPRNNVPWFGGSG